MKPIVLEKDEHGNIKITAEEIKQLIDDAYNDGYRDGSKSVQVIPLSAPSQPWWQPTWVGQDKITITCESLPTYLSD